MEHFLLEKHAVPKGVNHPNFEALASATNFTVYELKRLFCRFCILCERNGNTSGRVEKFTFLQQPELSFCYLAEFAFEYEQGKTKAKVAKGEPWPKGLDFRQFVTLFSEFSPLNPGNKKAECECGLRAVVVHLCAECAAQLETLTCCSAAVLFCCCCFVWSTRRYAHPCALPPPWLP